MSVTVCQTTGAVTVLGGAHASTEHAMMVSTINTATSATRSDSITHGTSPVHVNSHTYYDTSTKQMQSIGIYREYKCLYHIRPIKVSLSMYQRLVL